MSSPTSSSNRPIYTSHSALPLPYVGGDDEGTGPAGGPGAPWAVDPEAFNEITEELAGEDGVSVASTTLSGGVSVYEVRAGATSTPSTATPTSASVTATPSSSLLGSSTQTTLHTTTTSRAGSGRWGK